MISDIEDPKFDTIEIEINHNCNMSCSYCPNSIIKRSEVGEMKVQTFVTLMRQLKSFNFSGKVSYHFYNEPMLCTRLNLFVHLTKNYLPASKIELYTNGTLLTINRFNQLLQLGVDKFIVTKHENSKKYIFDKTLDLLTPSDHKHLIFINYKNMKLTNRAGTLKKVGMEESTSLLPCYIPQLIVSITLKGNVLPCFEDYKQKNNMGNINNMHIKEIWFSQAYISFRNNLQKMQRHLYETCRNCNRVNSVNISSFYH